MKDTLRCAGEREREERELRPAESAVGARRKKGKEEGEEARLSGLDRAYNDCCV
jgi:hypothetical protein